MKKPKEIFPIDMDNHGKAAALYYKIRSKKEFLRKLDTGKRCDIIHSSAHGGKEGNVGLGNGSTWLATPEEIEQTNHRARLVFASACLANRKTLADAFKGAKFFVAPQTEVPWINAAIFSIIFYKRYVADGVSLRSSFEHARNRTQTCKDYPDFLEIKTSSDACYQSSLLLICSFFMSSSVSR
jgi:hypothetical protein